MYHVRVLALHEPEFLLPLRPESLQPLPGILPHLRVPVVPARFATPPADCRPLQFTPPFEEWCGTDENETRSNLRRLQDLGMRGIVLNVNLENYLCSEPAWEIFRQGVRIAASMGLGIWIYDEKGYPSGAAGGLVLKEFPEGEAAGLVRSTDAGGKVKYETARLYEGTHATENFYEKRPYINILDPEAVHTFLQVTHERYARVLDPIGEYVEAFFTDEPSLITAYIPLGKTYPPTLPWHSRLPAIFLTRKGYDLESHLESLFADTGEIDRKIRCDFYEVLGDLCAETYFGQLQTWCHRNRVLSSGHLLGEETLYWQTLFEGDPFACYRKLDIPGIDMILSDPGRILREEFFLVPKLAGSAVRLQGKQRLMCEISDFLGIKDGHHATLQQMNCTAGMLTGLGVTDFVSMYRPPIRPAPGVLNSSWSGPAPSSEEEYRAYANHAARLRAVFSEGAIETNIAVLHPLITYRAHFVPSDRSMYEPHPDAHLEFVDRSFTDLCRDLLQQQMDFDIVDERSLADGRVEKGTLAIGNLRYGAIVLPPMDTARLATMETIARFVEQGGSVFTHPLVPVYAAEGFQHDGRMRELSMKICGAPGANETTGATDATGAAGATGASGPSGASEIDGPGGAASATGPDGAAGATGVTRVTRPIAAAGATGPAGAAGGTGPAGTSGADGPAGAPGAAQSPAQRLRVVDALKSRIPANCNLTPASQWILCTKISGRKGPTYFLVNTSPEEYRGVCTFHAAGKALILDPATGDRSVPDTEATGPDTTQAQLTMRPYQTLFVEFQPAESRKS